MFIHAYTLQRCLCISRKSFKLSDESFTPLQRVCFMYSLVILATQTKHIAD